LPRPLGPSLSCSDFVVHGDDGTWSITHAATISAGGASAVLWPTMRFREGATVAGLDVAASLDQQCPAARQSNGRR